MLLSRVDRHSFSVIWSELTFLASKKPMRFLFSCWKGIKFIVYIRANLLFCHVYMFIIKTNSFSLYSLSKISSAFLSYNLWAVSKAVIGAYDLHVYSRCGFKSGSCGLPLLLCAKVCQQPVDSCGFSAQLPVTIIL